jgi:hypothetical protein
MGEDTLKVQTYPAKADIAHGSALRNRQDTRFWTGHAPHLTRDPTRDGGATLGRAERTLQQTNLVYRDVVAVYGRITKEKP